MDPVKQDLDVVFNVYGTEGPEYQAALARVLARTAPLRELTSAERKAAPLHAGVLGYFPDALLAVSRVSKAGNDKHNPGEPLHWARGKSMDQLECVTRHLLQPEAKDLDTGEAHLAHAAWRVLAALQLAEEKRLVAAGIKPVSGVTSW